MASSLTLFASSSLYSSAARLEYFFLVSESLSKADPPYLVKNSVAEALPPTFIVLSWFNGQLSKFVDLVKKTYISTSKARDKGIDNVPDKSNVYTKVSVHAGAIQTDVDTKSYARPSGIPCLAIKTHLKSKTSDGVVSTLSRRDLQSLTV